MKRKYGFLLRLEKQKLSRASRERYEKCSILPECLLRRIATSKNYVNEDLMEKSVRAVLEREKEHERDRPKFRRIEDSRSRKTTVSLRGFEWRKYFVARANILNWKIARAFGRGINATKKIRHSQPPEWGFGLWMEKERPSGEWEEE